LLPLCYPFATPLLPLCYPFATPLPIRFDPFAAWEDSPKTAKQFIYAMNNKSNGKSRFKLTLTWAIGKNAIVTAIDTHPPTRPSSWPDG
jgi:hypothetical protein